MLDVQLMLIFVMFTIRFVDAFRYDLAIFLFQLQIFAALYDIVVRLMIVMKYFARHMIQEMIQGAELKLAPRPHQGSRSSCSVEARALDNEREPQ